MTCCAAVNRSKYVAQDSASSLAGLPWLGVIPVSSADLERDTYLGVPRS